MKLHWVILISALAFALGAMAGPGMFGKLASADGGWDLTCEALKPALTTSHLSDAQRNALVDKLASHRNITVGAKDSILEKYSKICPGK